MNGEKLIEWGFKPGLWFKDALRVANIMEGNGMTEELIRATVGEMAPGDLMRHTEGSPFAIFADPQTDDEKENMSAVERHMELLMQVPTIKVGVVMPDACPAGSAPGTIPVGGVVACENAIHPGFHSADICCSVAISVLSQNINASHILNAAMKISHFGAGGRNDNGAKDHAALGQVIASFASNPFLAGLEHRGLHHFMTQGDGNHFFFVGELNGQTVIVTHHGSRGLGADLYKRGSATADRMTRVIAQGIPSHQAWIPAETTEGGDYWGALQIVREWTKLNHFALHDAIAESLNARVDDRWWNEHNFVFQKSDGLFYHAKGATPNYAGFAPDNNSNMTLIPLNMAAGVLVADHFNFVSPQHTLEFCPHGAGRNMSRSQHMRRLMDEHGDSRGLSPQAVQQIIARETNGIDSRYFNGKSDLSELPSAYKNADQIVAEIEKHKLAHISARINPLGSIMAGNDDRDWKAIKAAKKARANAVEK